MRIQFIKLFLVILTVGILPYQTLCANEITRIEIEAENYKNKIENDRSVSSVALRDLYKNVKLAREQSDWKKAIRLLENILSIKTNDFISWMKLAEAWIEYDPAAIELPASAYNAYSFGVDDESRAEALLVIATHFHNQRNHKAALEFYRQVLELVSSDSLNNKLQQLEQASQRNSKRFSLRRGPEVIVDDKAPEICAHFSDQLDQDNPNSYKKFVTVNPPIEFDIHIEGKKLCFGGIEHGKTYEISYSAGLPSKSGLRLEQSEQHPLTLDDRNKAISFQRNTLILPKFGHGNIPLSTVNLKRVALDLLRITDRNLIGQILSDNFSYRLSRSDIDSLVLTQGESIWQGYIDIENNTNNEVLTAVPIKNLLEIHQNRKKDQNPSNEQQPIINGLTSNLPEADLDNGVYLLVARDGEDLSELPELDELSYDDIFTTQWLVSTDIGLTAYLSEDAFLVTAQSLSSGKPKADLLIQLVAKNNRVLAQATTDREGKAKFNPRLAYGVQGNALQAIYSHDSTRDFTFIDMSRHKLDISDHDISGFNIKDPVRAFVYSERELYRPGEDINVVALMRDRHGNFDHHIDQLPATISLHAPGGNRINAARVDQSFAGAREARLSIPNIAQSGTWEVQVRTAGGSKPIGRHKIQVKDFVPDRMEMTISTAEGEALRPSQDSVIEIEGNYLYGAPAANVHGEASVKLQKTSVPFPDYADYKFGLEDESFTSLRQVYRIPRTNDQGKATLILAKPNIPDTTQPLEALIEATLIDHDGSRVQGAYLNENATKIKGAYSLPVRPERNWIGVQFKSDADSIEEVSFNFVYLNSEGQALENGTLDVSIVEELDRFRWHRPISGYDPNWSYRHSITDKLIEKKTIHINDISDSTFTTTLGFGRYRIDISDGDKAATSHRFKVGWSNLRQSVNRPEALKILLSEPNYRTGNSAKISFKSPFDGYASVIIASDEIYKVDTNYPVSKGDDNEYDFQIDDGWNSSVYALLSLYRSSENGQPQASGMPERLFGTSHFSVDKSRLDMPLEIDVEEVITPGAIEVILNTSPPSGAETFATISLVDDGIHALTSYKDPDPIDFFLGKKQLNVDIFDNYNQIIHDSGRIRNLRSGAGLYGQLEGLGYRSKELVSEYSRILRIGEDGKASHTFFVPYGFSGRVRVNAIAWSASKIATAVKPIKIRTPVIADLGLPRFLSVGDETNVLLRLKRIKNNLGTYTATLSSNDDLEILEKNSIRLTEDKDSVYIFTTIKAKRFGEGEIKLSVKSDDDAELDFLQTHKITIRPPYPAITKRLVKKIKQNDDTNLSEEVYETGLQKDLIDHSISYSARFSLQALLPGLPLDELPKNSVPTADSLTTHANLLLTHPNNGIVNTENNELSTNFSRTIAELLLLQNQDGGFSQTVINESYGGTESELWLSAYALDLLFRANHRVSANMIPNNTLQNGIDFLRRELNRVLKNEVEDCPNPQWRSYALFVLSRENQLARHELERYYENCIDQSSNALSNAFTASALAAFGGFSEEVKILFNKAIESVPINKLSEENENRDSELRILSMILALALEARLENKLISSVRNLDFNNVDNLDETTLGWFSRANAALLQENEKSRQLRVEINDDLQPVREDGLLSINSISADIFRQNYTVANYSKSDITAELFMRGIPKSWPGRQNQGFEIYQHYYDLNGDQIDIDSEQINQRELITIVVEGIVNHNKSGDAIVSLLLPAGLQIEDIFMEQSQIRLAGLQQVFEKTHPQTWAEIKYRHQSNDRFVAVLNINEQTRRFKIAFLTRALNAGKYIVPPVTIEQLTAPEFKGSSEPKQMTITLPE